jgi:integral membrane protein (TIGR01906 family)
MNSAIQKRNPILSRILRFSIQLLVPILLILTSVRLLIVTANTWIPLEYRTPGFPDDPYGFTLEDRLKWSKVDVAYLLNDAEIDYFDQFQLDTGEPMHNERELIHMEDVKILVQNTWFAFRLGLILLLFLLIVLGWDQGFSAIWEVIRTGAKWGLVLLLLLVIGIGISFGVLFVGFHQIFFESGTWVFKYSDTFIRLYPERFWRDVFILLAGITAIQSGLVYWLAGLFIRRSTKGE